MGTDAVVVTIKNKLTADDIETLPLSVPNPSTSLFNLFIVLR